MSETLNPQTTTNAAADAKAATANRDAVPKDAAAVILLRPPGERDVTVADGARQTEVFWARRAARMAFLGGFYAFPGGQRDAEDAEVEVEHAGDAETAAMMACAARELFEEVGVLVARGADALTKGQRASLLDDLTSGRMTFAALLKHYGLRLDARDFTFVGRWVTPPFSPRRFDTLFFLVNCPPKQEPQILSGEFESGEWVVAKHALQRWQRAEALVAPPVLHALKVLSGGLTENLVERFFSVPQARREPLRRIEFLPDFICFPLRTPTKPPATHTNCYVIGRREIVVIDPGSPYEEEQRALADFLAELQREGRSVREIILTHLHPDHVGGTDALADYLEQTTGRRPPVAAHRLTAEALAGRVRADRHIEDEEVIELEGEPPLRLRALHTPGHTRGHLCFYDESTGALVTGDNVVGLGSVLIDPPEGDMRDYLRSLERLRSLPHLSVLFGGHGPAVGGPREKIDEYIAHRLERERNILVAIREGAATPAEIVARVYTDVPPKAHPMAERAVLAHLEKLEADGLITRDHDGRSQAV